MSSENQNNYWNNTFGYPYMYNANGMYNPYQGMYNPYGTYNSQYMYNPQMYYNQDLYNQGMFAPFIKPESIEEYLAKQNAGTSGTSLGGAAESGGSVKNAKTAEEYWKTMNTPVIVASEPEKEKKASETVSEIGESIKACFQQDENITLKEYKKEPWYSGKRIVRAAKNAGKGIVKTIGGFIGFENGKFNAKKCVKNLAVAAGTAALCAIPVVGPVLATGLVATGVVTGAVGVVKGACKAAQANTMEELDHAWEDIGSSGFIGISSTFGLRRMGKQFRTQNPKGYKVMKKDPTNPKAVVETGKVIEAKSDGWLADMFVNSFKGTKARVNADKVSCIENGFVRTTWAKLCGKPIEKRKTDAEFNAELRKAKSDLTRKITNIDRKVSQATTDQEKYVYEQVKASLQKQRASLDNVTTREQFVKLQETALETADDIANLSKIESNCGRRKGWYQHLEDGRKVTFKRGNKKLVTDAIDEIRTSRDAFGKTVSKLVDSRHESMLNMARTPNKGGNRNTLKNYFGEDKGYIGFKKLANSELKLNSEPTLFRQMFGLKKLWAYPVMPYAYGALTGTNWLYNIEQVLNPTYGNLISDDMKNIFASTSEYLEGFKKDNKTSAETTAPAGTKQEIGATTGSMDITG